MPLRSKRILQLAQLAAYTTIHNDTGEEDSMEGDFSPDYSNYSDNMSSSFTSSEDVNINSIEIVVNHLLTNDGKRKRYTFQK
jgi:hypothetical protein